MNKKGFTLIELLAVIVILAIIMLIATPLILGVVSDAKKGAARNSAMGYVDALEKQIIINEIQREAGDDSVSDLFNATITSTDAISVRGNKPENVSLEISNGVIVSGTIKFNGFVYSVTDGSVSADTVTEE